MLMSNTYVFDPFCADIAQKVNTFEQEKIAQMDRLGLTFSGLSKSVMEQMKGPITPIRRQRLKEYGEAVKEHMLMPVALVGCQVEVDILTARWHEMRVQRAEKALYDAFGLEYTI